MQYLGSKNRIAKHLLPIILNDRQQGQYYVEPFVGGANMIDKVDGNRIGADVHYHLIKLHKSIQCGWIPPTSISRELYYEIKKHPHDYDDDLVGFVGFLCSFGGAWWNAYAKNSKGDNYAARGSRMMIKQSKNIQDVKFIHCSYQNLVIPPNSIIYCDPPYRNTRKYKDVIDYDEFYQWCRKKVNDGHKVYVSEYDMPDDFICVHEIKTTTKLNKNIHSDRIEKLFIHNTQIH